MKRFPHLSLALLGLLALACQREPASSDALQAASAQPRAHGDARAIEIAERVLERNGGRAAWESTRYVSWRFFGNRRHVWDKWTGDLRVENKDRVALVNLNDGTGRVFDAEQEISEPGALAQAIAEARAIWINDSYWMFMPYKLLDEGVRLAYDGLEKLSDGREADVLSMTFENVGLTPENRYRVFVARDSGRVEAWSFFERASDPEAQFSLPWGGWKRFGDIWLATEHGKPADWQIAVHAELPRTVFDSPAPIRL